MWWSAIVCVGEDLAELMMIGGEECVEEQEEMRWSYKIFDPESVV